MSSIVAPTIPSKGPIAIYVLIQKDYNKQKVQFAYNHPNPSCGSKARVLVVVM
jgi:hypothetical protein